ncbi:MAG: hypothetical protein RTU30_15465 [Candidatus Thorarchaeota archaeon]
MKVEVYDAFNPDAIMKINPREFVHTSLGKVNTILKYLSELRPELSVHYITALKKRLLGVVNNFHVKATLLGDKDVIDNLEYLKGHLDLQNLIFQFACKHLNITDADRLKHDEIEVSSFNYTKAFERLPYQILKAFTEILDDEQTKTLWASIVSKRLADERADYEKAVEERKKKGEKKSTPSEHRARTIKRWCEMGLADFTMGLYDEHKVLYRFDRCLTHEVLKDLYDPDWAYLSSCYVGDHPDYNSFGKQYLKRTQTLHHGDFCDELYWYIDVHTDPQRPSLEFTRNLGKKE